MNNKPFNNEMSHDENAMHITAGRCGIIEYE